MTIYIILYGIYMNIVIRKESFNEFRIVESIARDAFWNLYFPGAHEHYVVHKMRSHPDFIKELSFVIEVDGKIEGAIFFTRSKIVSNEGIEYETISFGPVFISPSYHRLGLGKKLIEYSIQKAKDMGYRAIITLGYPYHYECYGFLSGKRYNISMDDGKYYVGLLVLPLYSNALKNISGHAIFSDVFDVSEKDVDEYDKHFPNKEKKYEKSQTEYENAIALLDK